MGKEKYRKVADSMGELEVPQSALWGAQTQRAVNNFPISGICIPRQFIAALGLIKWSAAQVNNDLGLLSKEKTNAIMIACEAIIEGQHDGQFPIDIFQTGSGTSSNMNANEVIANLATSVNGTSVHPNDDVNMGQSSNDVIPTAIHIAAAIAIDGDLLPALSQLDKELESKAHEYQDVVKTGRTHLMDAMPITLSQEITGWRSQLQRTSERINDSMSRLMRLAQGGTAVGTGINAHPDFGNKFAELLAKKTNIPFTSSDSFFESISTQDTAIEVSGHLKVLAVNLIKISNDLRWMNSGPLAGLGEIKLPELQPGSSIMPGKVNPVIPEAVAMVGAQVIGNDSAITIAGQSGNFQLNVMLPVVAHNLIQSISILSNAMKVMAEKAICGFTVNEENIKEMLDRNPILVTALNSVIGYELGAKIAKKAYQEGRAVKDVAVELTDLSEADLDRLLDPKDLTKGGIKE
ncbi:MAG: class II fumarate hydratase [Woeseiaceae bacterium]|nr:class II fumarate hydratase [Woeseiaceae bacterium]